MLSPELQKRLETTKMKMLFDKNVAGFYIPYSYLPVTEANIPTFRTDGRQILINPKFAATLTDTQFKGVFFHEILHNVLGHLLEIDVKYPAIYKKACEYAVNNIVLACEYELTEGAWINPDYEGWSTLAIYEDLVKQLPPDYQENPDESNNFSPFAPPNPNGNNEEPGEGESGTGDQESCCKGGCIGKIPEGVSDIPEDELGTPPTQETVKNNLAQTEQILKSSGASPKITKTVTDILESFITPSMHWTEELIDSAIKCLSGEVPDLANPIKQYMPDIYIPQYKSENIETLYTAFDFSSSVSPEELGMINRILNILREMYEIELNVVITFNTRVIKRFEFEAHEQIDIKQMKSGGGTRIDCVFEHLEERGETPNALLILSDMEDYIETEYVPYPVIWLNTSPDEFWDEENRPKFGKHIHVRKDLL